MKVGDEFFTRDIGGHDNLRRVRHTGTTPIGHWFVVLDPPPQPRHVAHHYLQNEATLIDPKNLIRIEEHDETMP